MFSFCPNSVLGRHISVVYIPFVSADDAWVIGLNIHICFLQYLDERYATCSEIQDVAHSIFLREGPCTEGASWVICGSRVQPYDSLHLYGVFNDRFYIKKRLGKVVRVPQLSSIHIDSLGRAVSQPFLI